MATVEPVFGTLINFMGMRKVNTRGQSGANKCMLMAATAFNLKKLLKYALKPTKTAIKSLEIPEIDGFRWKTVQLKLYNLKSVLINHLIFCKYSTNCNFQFA